MTNILVDHSLFYQIEQRSRIIRFSAPAPETDAKALPANCDALVVLQIGISEFVGIFRDLHDINHNYGGLSSLNAENPRHILSRVTAERRP